jgi:hypothetical protein
VVSFGIQTLFIWFAKSLCGPFALASWIELSLYHGTRGTYLQEGIKVGFVTHYFGKVILEARAPISRVSLHINAIPSRNKSDNIADIAAQLPPKPSKSASSDCPG